MRYLNRTVMVWAGVLFSVAVWGALALISSVKLSETIKLVKQLPNVVTVDCIALWFFASYAWRWRIFRGWLVPFPDLNGTWQGTIQTTWIDSKTGAKPGPIPVLLVIHQSFATVCCTMRTGEMTSHSYSADFVIDGDSRVHKLVYSYRSNPKPTVAERSQPHEGTIVFEIIGNPPRRLKGEYWTSRKTTGEVLLAFKSKRYLDDLPSNLPPHPVSEG